MIATAEWILVGVLIGLPIGFIISSVLSSRKVENLNQEKEEITNQNQETQGRKYEWIR